ncbi:unnamed protein product [Didymodactylos carnosus]|uniref:Uncharacterized protein n=1 Tax=Didymodactylos carnosus TaxID=1234261 RepID=A0A813YVQ3_9BILA|nr:unnamed protein product [Didymodactylos carnosus]CAF0967489.1 unnamed protein product [Didymodactylos carnosus]CAF3674339.1 unnamed protein product [Didymodactylos carnosus]CAF3739180.1 unnamed protein product [Didymodactylos carnosus]
MKTLLFIIIQSATLYNTDSDEWLDEQLKTLTDDQLEELDRFADKSMMTRSKNNDDNAELTRYTRHVKRDALWTTTEVLDCIRRLKHFGQGTKLDLVTEMLNCYRRMKNIG